MKELSPSMRRGVYANTGRRSAKILFFFKFLDKKWPRISRMNTDQIRAHP